MEICVKKTYCPKCGRLVSCKDQSADHIINVRCRRCNTLLWSWNGINWEYLGKGD